MSPSRAHSSTAFALLCASFAFFGCAVQQDGEPKEASQTITSTRPLAHAPIVDPPSPPTATHNPLASANLYVDPDSLAMLTANAMRESQPESAKILDRIAQRPMGLWLGGWNTDIFRSVEHFTGRAVAANSVPVMIAYNIPHRDCGQYSEGGLADKEAYQRWIRDLHAGIGSHSAVVILEPDALGHFQECLSEEQKEERMFLLRDAVKVLRQNPKTAVYLDAGHARWVEADEMAKRLMQAGVEYASGFSLNVSNYVSTEENLKYGQELSTLTGGKHFVIDTSRNGAGPYEEAKTEEEGWCNPPGRKIGLPPTTNTSDELCHAFLWLKRPGESDGTCNGGPVAGAFWTERALQMAQK